jgi:hypothetical protein
MSQSRFNDQVISMNNTYERQQHKQQDLPGNVTRVDKNHAKIEATSGYQTNKNSTAAI